MVYDINTHNKDTTTMLQRVITNSHRHAIELKVGSLNAASDDCAYQAIIANIEDIGYVSTTKFRIN